MIPYVDSSGDEMPPLVDSSSDDDMPPIVMSFERDPHRHRYGHQSPPTSDEEPDSDDEENDDEDENPRGRTRHDDDDPDDDDDDGDDDEEESDEESEPHIDPLAGNCDTCGKHHHHQCWACALFVGVNMYEVQTRLRNDDYDTPFMENLSLPTELRMCGRDYTHMDPPGTSSEIPWDWHLCRRCIRDLLDILEDDNNRAVAGPPVGPESEPVTLVIRRLQWIYTMIAPYIGNAGGEPWVRGFNHIEYNINDEGAVFDDPTVEWSPVQSETDAEHDARTRFRSLVYPPRNYLAGPQNRSGIHRLHHPPYAGYNYQDFRERLPLHLYGFHNLYSITEDFAQDAENRYTPLLARRFWSCLEFNQFHGPFENPNPGTQTSLQRDYWMNATAFGYDTEDEGGPSYNGQELYNEIGTEADDESPTEANETDREADAGTVTGAGDGDAENDDLPDIAPAAPAQPFSSGFAKKKNKKQQSGMGATPPQWGDAQAANRKSSKTISLDHCDTSRRYQSHLRETLFPCTSHPKRVKLAASSSCASELLPEDVAGLKWAEPRINSEKPYPGIFHAQRPESPKRARTKLQLCSRSPPCQGLCPKTGWSIQQFCSFCHAY